MIKKGEIQMRKTRFFATGMAMAALLSSSAIASPTIISDAQPASNGEAPPSISATPVSPCGNSPAASSVEVRNSDKIAEHQASHPKRGRTHETAEQISRRVERDPEAAAWYYYKKYR
jgi:hypothetical protein